MSAAPSTTPENRRTSGAARAAFGPRTLGGMSHGSSDDHAGKPAPLHLPTAAYAVFCAARGEADPTTGILENRFRLVTIVRRSESQVRHWLGYLEGVRFRNRQLVQRHGARELWVNLVNIPGVPARPEAPDPFHDRTRRTQNGDWRAMRARIGGLQRSFQAARAREDQLRAELNKVMERPRADQTEAELVALRELLVHAVGCPDPDCETCWDLSERLRDHDPQEPTGVELLVAGKDDVLEVRT